MSDARYVRHDAVAATLSSLSDEAVRELLDAGTEPRTSIGGMTRTIEVAETPVFVKAITLTDREVDAGPATQAICTTYRRGITTASGRAPLGSTPGGKSPCTRWPAIGCSAAQAPPFLCCITGGCCPTSQVRLARH